MNLKRLIVYALMLAVVPDAVGFLFGLAWPRQSGEPMIYAVRLGIIWFVVAFIYARMAYLERAHVFAHIVALLLLGWILGEAVGAALLLQLESAMRADLDAAEVWPGALTHLGIDAALALAGCAAAFLLRRWAQHEQK